MVMAIVRVKVRYICGGCGWRWARDFKCPIKLANVVPAEKTVTVPEFASPCCGESAGDEVES